MGMILFEIFCNPDPPILLNDSDDKTNQGFSDNEPTPPLES